MYGSGSLRPPGTNPIDGAPQPKFRKPTSTPNYGKKPAGSRFPYAVPYPPLQTDLYPLDYSPRITPHDVTRSGAMPRTRLGYNGKWGGRPEYFGGPPNQFFSRSRYPIDYGFIPGHGFKVSPNRGTIRYGRPPNGGIVDHANNYMKDPDSDGGDGGLCGGSCAPDEFLCQKSCVCINSSLR